MNLLIEFSAQFSVCLKLCVNHGQVASTLQQNFLLKPVQDWTSCIVRAKSNLCSQHSSGKFRPFRFCSGSASAAGVVPEQACEVQETGEAGSESHGADGDTNLQRHNAEHVPNSEQGLPTLRASQHYQHYEQIPSGKLLTSIGHISEHRTDDTVSVLSNSIVAHC
jgi:hypothetical protein